MARISTAYALYSGDMTWNAKTQTLIAEASDINFHAPYQLYDDAADVGVWVRSHRTQKLMPFNLAKITKDAEGDIQFWTFECWSRGGVLATLKIFND